MNKFISYAQNFEDVMLSRALKHIQTGFFVDVGANDPVIDSVTKAFSLSGWRGINIEPAACWYEKLVKDRPKDINLCVAASNSNGFIDFYEVADSGLSTTKIDVAQRHIDAGLEVVRYTVPCIRLNDILEKHQITTIHFLKIDVEGGEEEVLRGIDFEKNRPWIILVEATEPNSVKPSFLNWEQYLLENGYEHVYFDGFNRYYIAEDHSDLRPAFDSPPNVLDNFVQYHEWLANQTLKSQLEDCHKTFVEITSGFSWRITKPLRAPVNIFNTVRKRWFK